MLVASTAMPCANFKSRCQHTLECKEIWEERAWQAVWWLAGHGLAGWARKHCSDLGCAYAWSSWIPESHEEHVGATRGVVSWCLFPQHWDQPPDIIHTLLWKEVPRVYKKRVTPPTPQEDQHTFCWVWEESFFVAVTLSYLRRETKAKEETKFPPLLQH